MATSHSLKAETRACGSGNLKQLRSQGLVPGVVYGPGFDNVNIQVDAREFARMLASAVSEHILVALDINGKIVKVLLKEVQHNPITNACLHVDFQAVTDTTVIHSIVPVILEGDSAGVALGGVLDQTIHELAIICQVKDLPEAITADISGLKLGESLRIADLKLPSGVTTELAGDVIVAIVEAPPCFPARKRLRLLKKLLPRNKFDTPVSSFTGSGAVFAAPGFFCRQQGIFW